MFFPVVFQRRGGGLLMWAVVSAAMASMMACSHHALADVSVNVPAPLPLMLRVVASSPAAVTPSSIAAQATRAAEWPARYLAAAGGRWHSITLDCPDEASCQEAVRRLRSDTAHFDAVESDARRRAAVAPRTISP